MSDFDDARKRLVQGRKDQQAARARVAQASETLKGITATRDRLARRVGANDLFAAEHARLEAVQSHAAASLAAAKSQAARAADEARAALDRFAAFTDPRTNASRLDDTVPFALFPVRLETRFASVPSRDGDGQQPQLWVRIYPDDCSIDTFEAMLSATELQNAQRYWRGIWRAGGVEADERAAWASLVSAHGSGRAGYIADTYLPLNPADKPVKAKPSDVILTISMQTTLNAAQAAALGLYWQAIWRADDILGQQQAARAALDAAVGTATAAQLIAEHVPFNLGDRLSAPLKKGDVTVSVAYLVFAPDPATRQAAWTEAPRVEQFPERFVVLGFSGGEQTLLALGNVVASPLYVGPDPSADPKVDPGSTIHPSGNDLVIPEPLQWMVDIDQAVAAGMGLAIDLSPQQARSGFDRLLVLGLQLSANAQEGQATLETLLQHHATGRSGLSIVPQGTPTHNSSGSGTGYTAFDSADQSFDDRRQRPLFTPTPNTRERRDGQWLAEALGVAPSVMEGIHGAGGRDQLQSRAMQHALWPATMGYWMDKLLTPVFSDEAVDHTRWYFTEHVSGRGALPSIRIGGQPYGVLPTTAFSRIRWLDQPPIGIGRLFQTRPAYLRALYQVLRVADADWVRMSQDSAHLGAAASDAHEQLLGVLGLHPSSVEFHSRFAESLSELFNTINLWGLGPDFIQALIALGLHAASFGLLTQLGYTEAKPPDILSHYFLRDAQPITQLIDDRPLSETDSIRPYTDTKLNYLHWLVDAANQSLDAVRLESGFSKDVTPQALLYLYARHAVMLGYYDASYELHKAYNVLNDVQLAAMKPEPAFVHVSAAATPSESRFAALYKTQSTITGNASQSIADYITLNYRFLTAAEGLRDQIDALAQLADASTAQLERAFVEHIDLCSYRFDAWMLGLVNYQLQQMRTGGEAPATGIYLGAYAWLEDLRPSNAELTAVQLPPDVAGNFPGKQPILSDASNGGHIHAPSLTHARTAAVLRSGYVANASPANPKTLAVNLSSARVRLALSLLEGTRNGQPLGALLGYEFERGLHDAYGLAEVDKFIYPLRKAFPLVADTLSSGKTAPDVPIEAIEARNVLDGRKLIAQIDASGVATYPYGLTTTLPNASAAELLALNAQSDAIRNAYDAIADLALAEGVHQAVQGNFNRVAATLDAYSVGHFPPEPQVVQTPAEGIGLNHRVAVHFASGLAPSAAATPRAQAQPSVEAWVAQVLPPLTDIGCVVSWTDAVGTPRHHNVLLSDLALGALDVLALIQSDPAQAMTEFDDRVLQRTITHAAPRPDATLKIGYMSAPANKFSIWEVSALVRSVNALLRSARPLRSSDVTLSQTATLDTDADVFVDRARIALPQASQVMLGGDITAFIAVLAPLLADPVVNRTALITGVDGFIDKAVTLLERASRLSLPLCGWGFAHAWRHAAVRDLLAQVNDLLQRWQVKLADFDAKSVAYDGLPAATGDTERFAALRAAELVISTTLLPQPATPALLRSQLNGKRNAFDARRGQFAAVLASIGTSFLGFLNAIEALLPVSDLDAAPFSTTEFGDRAVRFVRDLSVNMTGHLAELTARSDKVKALLTTHDGAAAAGARVAALESAAKVFFGDDFRIVPEFGLSAAQGDEWANALAASTGGTLLSYLETTLKIDFPIDEWLAGAARVRPALRTWESIAALSAALSGPEASLTPIQLPYAANALWLAMQFPADHLPNSERLLYTAHYATPFDKTIRQCGLLVDSWSEVIPSTTHTTGLSFHFNRPDNEPPQAILIVTPASSSGQWVWDDLVAALSETLDLAKKRAVEPSQLDNTPYAALLPATVMAATLYGISISTNLGVANGLMLNAGLAQHG